MMDEWQSLLEENPFVQKQKEVVRQLLCSQQHEGLCTTIFMNLAQEILRTRGTS